MKQYKIIVTPDAEEDLRKYVAHLRDVKRNPQAVKSVLADFRDTKKSLKNVAGSIKEPDSEKLKERSLKRMNFLRHNYFVLFYIGDDDKVYITDVFHGLEDYESKLR